MKHLEFRTSLSSVTEFAEKNNQTYKRGHKFHINSTRLAIMANMVKIYGGQIRRLRTRTKPGRPSKAELELWNNLPALCTNNIELAKKTMCSDRTVRRHVKDLTEQGVFIEKKIYHGPEADYEIWISPEILKLTDGWDLQRYKEEINRVNECAKEAQEPTLKTQTAVEYIQELHDKIQARQKATKEQQAAKNQAWKTRHEKSLTDNLATSSNTFLTEINQNTINLEKRSESNPTVPDQPISDRFDYQTELPSSAQAGNLEQETQPKQSEPSGDTGTYSAGRGQSFQQKESLGNKIARQLGVKRTTEAKQGDLSTMKEDLMSKPFRGDTLLAQAKTRSTLLWKLMCKLLYAETPLDDYQVETAQDILLWYYSSARSVEALDKLHANYCERVEMVHRWVKAKPYRFITLPSKYLDMRNKDGFIKTIQWTRKRENDRLNKQMLVRCKRITMEYNNNPTVEMYEACLQVISQELTEFYVARFKWYVDNKVTNAQLNLSHAN